MDISKGLPVRIDDRPPWSSFQGIVLVTSSPISPGLILFLLLHRVLADAHTAWVIVLARPPATPCPAGKACLSAHRGVVPGVEESEAEVLGNWSQGTLPAPCPPFTRARLGDFRSQGQFFNPRPCATLLPLSGILGSRTPGAGALGARGIALTCNHIGKQPQAGLGRGPKAREGGKGAATGRASWSKQPVMGWVPWLKGLSQAGLPWEQADWRLPSSLLSPA